MGMPVGVDEAVDRFMAERDRMVGLEVGADLFRAQIAREQGHNEGLTPSGQFAVFARICPSLPLAVEIPRPVIRVQMRAGPHIAPLFSADRGGRAPECSSDVHRALAFAHRLMNVEPFLIAQMMVVSHRALPSVE